VRSGAYRRAPILEFGGKISQPNPILRHRSAHEADRPQRQGVRQRVEREVPVLTADDDVHAKQLGEVLGDRLVLGADEPRELAHGLRTACEGFEQLEPHRMADHAQPVRGGLEDVQRARSEIRTARSPSQGAVPACPVPSPATAAAVRGRGRRCVLSRLP
jgi:hypothetical protein